MGEDVLAMADGAPMAILADEKAAWPAPKGKERDPAWQFGGYELDAKRRPTFFYTFGKVEVRDYFEPVAEKPHPGFRRKLQIERKEPVEKLVLRLAVAKKVEQNGSAFTLDNGLRITVSGAIPTTRQAAGGAEVLIFFPSVDGKAVIEVTYAW
jgi:hypothetical protein